MELVMLDETKVIYLTTVNRAAGQIYQPEIMAKVAHRYSFAKTPALEDIGKDVNTFAIGKFRDVQISELRVYGDGIIVSGRVNTKIIDAFIEDLFSWLKTEFGITEIKIQQPEKYYESSIIVQAKLDVAQAIKPTNNIEALLNSRLKNFDHIDAKYGLTGFVLDTDPTKTKGRRRPFRFLLERRAGLAYEDNIFYSQAPLGTDDHLELLGEFERLLVR